MNQPGRRTLPHKRPFSLSENRTYFVTVCAHPCSQNHLARPEVAKRLIDSSAWRHEHARDFIKEIQGWEKFTARALRIPWQRDFFEHRLHREESRSENNGTAEASRSYRSNG